MNTTLSGVGVLDKAMALMARVELGPCTLGELMAATGTARATCHRLAVALEAHAMLRRDADGRFVLGARLIGLGEEAARSMPLMAVARPVLDQLRDDTGESAQVWIHEGDHRRCLVAVDSPHELRTMIAAGSLLPLGVGSAGRVLSGEPPSRAGRIETVAEREPGVASVSAPVHDADGMVVAAVSVSGPIERISRNPGRRHGARVVTAARQLAAATS